MTLDNPIDMQTFEDAVHEWFSEAIECQAIWAQQSAPRPSYPYGVLNIISGPIPASSAWENKASTDLTRARGTEIKFETRVPCTFVISCQVHVVGADGRNPDVYARTLVIRALARLKLITVRDIFRTANIAVQGTGPVTNISAIVNDGYVSRSGVDVTFNASLSLDEYIGYIKTVEVESVSPSNLNIDMTIGDI